MKMWLVKLGSVWGGITGVILKPIFKMIAGCYVLTEAVNYGQWQSVLQEVKEINPSIKECIPIHISKTHDMFLWLYNTDIIKYFFIKIANIAFYFKLPIYVITWGVILFFILMVVIWLRRVAIRNLKNIGIDINNPKTLLQQTIIESDVDLQNAKKKIMGLKIALGKSEAEIKKLYNYIKELENLKNVKDNKTIRIKNDI